MGFYALHVVRKRMSNSIEEAIVLNSRTGEYYGLTKDDIINAIMSNSIRIYNLGLEQNVTGKIKVVLRGMHKGLRDYSISKFKRSKGLVEENLCVVVNGGEGLYEVRFATGSSAGGPKYCNLHSAISTVEGLQNYVSDAIECCMGKQYKTGFNIFNAKVSTQRKSKYERTELLDIVNPNECNISRHSNFIVKNIQSYFDYCDILSDDSSTYAPNFIRLRQQINQFKGNCIPVFSSFEPDRFKMVAIYGKNIDKELNITNAVGCIDIWGNILDSDNNIVNPLFYARKPDEEIGWAVNKVANRETGIHCISINAPNGLIYKHRIPGVTSIVIRTKVGKSITLFNPFEMIGSTYDPNIPLGTLISGLIRRFRGTLNVELEDELSQLVNIHDAFTHRNRFIKTLGINAYTKCKENVRIRHVDFTGADEFSKFAGKRESACIYYIVAKPGIQVIGIDGYPNCAIAIIAD